ncbi:MAG: ABC transporter substrate-binding protein [Bauldia sp.]
MARRRRGWAAATALAVAFATTPALGQGAPPAPAAPAAPAAAAPITPFQIGFVDLVEDARFDPEYAYNMVPVRPWGRAFQGAELGIVDAEQIGRAINVSFSLVHASGTTPEELAAAIGEWVGQGIHFVVVDLPADQLLALSDLVAGLEVTLFNVSAPEDSLRAENCRANVVHTAPSTRMLTDALVQYLVFRRWTNILVLQGPLPQDAATVEAIRASAGQFGARIVDVRPFVFGADPRDRDQNNVALITAGGGYDVVYIADTDGDFARYVPYDTQDARPVVGAAGLTAQAWHWAWERQGAPQVNARFWDLTGRLMADTDWAAWVAVKAIVQSVLRGQSTEYGLVRDYLLGERMNLDGTKGYPMNVRPWDHQLRQSILLGTGNAIIQLAPVEGFIHQTNDLDTLGVDAPQSVCRF